MAYKIQFDDLEKLEERLKNASDKTIPIMKHCVYEGAKVAHDAVLGSLKSSIKGNGNPDNGKHLVDSFFYGKMKVNAGSVAVDIFFDDYDSLGVPQPLKANVLESGTSDGRVSATHFFSRGIRGARDSAVQTMSSEFEEYLTNSTK